MELFYCDPLVYEQEGPKHFQTRQQQRETKKMGVLEIQVLMIDFYKLVLDKIFFLHGMQDPMP